MIITEKVNTTDIKTKIVSAVTINTAKGAAFRLVHDGETAFQIIDGTDKTVTSCIYTIEEYETEKECLTVIEKIGLKYTPPEIEPISVLNVKSITAR